MTTAFMEEKLSDGALLGGLNEVINNVRCAESHSQLSIRDIVGQLDPLVEDFKGLNSVLYNSIESYRDAGQTAMDENRENSFDTSKRVLERLNGIKAKYLESLVEAFPK